MSLVTTAQVRALINTSLSDGNLQTIIDRVEAQITEKIGAHQVDGNTTEISRTVRGEGSLLFMSTEIYSIVRIVEDDVLLDADDYEAWPGGVIERLPIGSYWGDRCEVVYKPTDDRLKRAQVIIDLVRLTSERTALKSESIAGEYSYSAPDNWDVEFRKAMKRLMFKAV